MLAKNVAEAAKIIEALANLAVLKKATEPYSGQLTQMRVAIPKEVNGNYPYKDITLPREVALIAFRHWLKSLDLREGELRRRAAQIGLSL